MRTFVFILWTFLVFSNSVAAQFTEKEFDVDLWTNGLPNTNGIDRTPFDDNIQNYKPSLRVFLPSKEKATGRAVIACPGGAYGGLAYGHEGYEWAPFFNKLGITLVVLKYRMPRGTREVPFSDAEEALRLVKEKAKEWNINPADIGIMGSSAGGHLASTIATHSTPEYRPSFQILFYPVISMEHPLTHEDTHNSFLGNNPPPELEAEFTNYKQVKSDTPRAIIFFSSDDTAVPVMNGVEYYKALNTAGVPAALHIYLTGAHGWGYNTSFPYHNAVVEELSTWLKSF